MLEQSEETIRENLFLEEDDCFWQDWKEDIITTIRKYEKLYQDNFYGWGYCLESDLDREIDYLNECNIMVNIIANDNGLIIYETRRKK